MVKKLALWARSCIYGMPTHPKGKAAKTCTCFSKNSPSIIGSSFLVISTAFLLIAIQGHCH